MFFQPGSRPLERTPFQGRVWMGGAGLSDHRCSSGGALDCPGVLRREFAS
jgi:hypothetical protein